MLRRSAVPKFRFLDIPALRPKTPELKPEIPELKPETSELKPAPRQSQSFGDLRAKAVKDIHNVSQGPVV